MTDNSDLFTLMAITDHAVEQYVQSIEGATIVHHDQLGPVSKAIWNKMRQVIVDRWRLETEGIIEGQATAGCQHLEQVPYQRAWWYGSHPDRWLCDGCSKTVRDPEQCDGCGADIEDQVDINDVVTYYPAQYVNGSVTPPLVATWRLCADCAANDLDELDESI